MEATPHDHSQGPPPQAARPKGPPVPRPVHPRPSVNAAPADSPDVEQPDAAAPPSDSDSDRARRWPLIDIYEDGNRFQARLQGPHLPNGRFAESSDSASDIALSSSSATSDGNGSDSQGSLTWSESSLVLAGPSLETAKGVLLGQFRMELFAVNPGLSSRSQGARVGSLRRRLASSSWQDVQQAAHRHLTADRRRIWSEWASSVSLTTAALPGTWLARGAFVPTPSNSLRPVTPTALVCPTALVSPINPDPKLKTTGPDRALPRMQRTRCPLQERHHAIITQHVDGCQRNPVD